MKYSHQREEILTIIKASQGHMSATDVYRKVKNVIPNISLGTVYRNLNALADHGFIRRIIMPYESDLYDYNIESHSHLYCLKCKQLFDLNPDVDKKRKHLVEKTTGHRITKSSVVFEGICHRCVLEEEG